MNRYSIIKSGTTAMMEWSTTSESNTDKFVMERSQDGIHFIQVNEIPAHGNPHNYQLIDSSPLPGDNYYRLKLIDIDGSVTIFPVKRLNFSNDGIKPLSVYPNPVQGNLMNVSLQGEGDRNLVLYNSMGQQVKKWDISGDETNIQLSLPGGMTAGVYLLSMIEGEIVWTEKLVIE